MKTGKYKNPNILMDAVYEEKMINFFKKWVSNFHGIDCYAILVLLPNNEMLHLSTHSALSIVYKEHDYGLYDQPVIKEHYKNFLFYPWKMPNATRIQQEIHDIRERIFNLNSGTNFVRKVNTEQGLFHIVYCVSSLSKDPLNYFRFASNAKAILELGDFSYNSMLPIFQENCEKFTLPSLEKNRELIINSAEELLKNYVLSEEMSNSVLQFINNSKPKLESEYQLHNALRIAYSNKTISNTSNKEKPNLRLISRTKF